MMPLKSYKKSSLEFFIKGMTFFSLSLFIFSNSAFSQQANPGQAGRPAAQPAIGLGAKPSAGSSENSSKQHAAGISLGYNLLMGDFGKDFDNGLGFGALYDFEASELFGVLTELRINSHSNALDTSHLSLIGLTPNLKVNLAYLDKLVAFGTAGLGIYKASEKFETKSGTVVTSTREGSITTVGFSLGGGFHLHLDDHFIFGSRISFNNILSGTDSTPTPAITIGGTYISLDLNVLYAF